MCGFLVYTNNNISKLIFEQNLAKVKHRGPDEVRVDYTTGMWGFNRLEIMGLTESGMQPFQRGLERVVCNGELYGFRAIKKELEKKQYVFNSNSDCELLLPLWEEKGVNFFSDLDAEFACVLFDGKEFIAARDPIGIRSMFYGYSKVSHDIAFASEAKALIDICDEIKPFPPGHYYYKGQFIKYYDVTKVEHFNNDDFETIYKNINIKLTAGVIKRLDADVPIGFLLSGGLDSSLVCSIATKHLNKPIKTFAIGMENDAIDLKYAKEVADYIKSIHHEVVVTKNDILSALNEVIYHLETWDITTIRASLCMYLLCKWIKKNTDIKVILTGEVSDELFGYKYTDFAPSPEAFQAEAVKRIDELYMYDVLRADRCISGASLEGRVPFADLDFVKYVMSIDPAKKINIYNKGKFLLRKAFESDYLPKNILYREKAAFSDAVGHSMVDYLKAYANELYSDTAYLTKKAKYAHHQPFTKESLLYREIFESFYPNYSDWIVDYWMPNKSWLDVDVDDPSARVLKNYGDSGK